MGYPWVTRRVCQTANPLSSRCLRIRGRVGEGRGVPNPVGYTSVIKTAGSTNWLGTPRTYGTPSEEEMASGPSTHVLG